MAIAMGWQKPDNVAGSSAPAIMVGLFVASGGLLFGYDTGAINGILAMTEFKEQFGSKCYDDNGKLDICTKDSSIIVAILSAGTTLGALLAAPAGGVFQVCAQGIAMMLAGRMVAGVGVGSISVLVPLYQSEMAPKWIRGALVCAYQLSITVGLFAASVVNIITSRIHSSAAYRTPLGLQIVPALILTAGLILLPETPRFLVKQGRKTEAGLALSRLRRLDLLHPALVDELEEMDANYQWELTRGPDTYKTIFVGLTGKRTFTGCGLQMLQQLTGINFIMYYSTSFFDGAGVESPYTKSLIINVINVVSTIPGMLVIEHWGRRRLLMTGALGMAACQLLMASFNAATGDDMKKVSQTILVTFCAVNIFFFAASWGPVVWVVTSEIYPLKVRAKAMSVSTASNWVLNFAIAYSSPFMLGDGPGNAAFGPKIFFIWGAFCILAVFFVWCMVYETSKLSLEQIDEMYERVDHAWNSKDFDSFWSFQDILQNGFAPSGQPPANHELQTTTTTSSADTSLGSTDSPAITVNNSNNNDNAASNDQNKAPPAMANVDFSY